MAWGLGKLGQTQEALEIINEMIDWRGKGRKVRAYFIGFALHGIGRDEEALKWLEIALADHEPVLAGLPNRGGWG